MKKFVSVLLAITIIFSLSVFASAEGNDFRVSDAVIVVGKNAVSTDLYAGVIWYITYKIGKIPHLYITC